MPGSLLLYNLPWLPRTHSTTSTLLSLEPEAFRAILLLLLITRLTLAGMEYGLHFPTSTSFFTGISPSGVPSFLLPIVVNCLSPARPARSSFNAPPLEAPSCQPHSSVLFAAEMPVAAAAGPSAPGTVWYVHEHQESHSLNLLPCSGLARLHAALPHAHTRPH